MSDAGRESVPETRRTLCNRDCPDACGIIATVEAGRVTALRGDPAHPVTRGFLCHRTSHFLNLQYGPTRLTTPLWRRTLDAPFSPIGWDAALALAAEQLLRIRAESGPAAIFHYRSGGSLGMMANAVDLLFERFGPVTVKRGDICSGAGEAAQEADFGVSESSDLFALRHARHVLLWGKNVVVSSPHTLPVLREAMAGGARCVLIDPVFHKTASYCERFVQVRPGGDVALAMAVAGLLLEAGLSDAVAARCDHLEAYCDLVRSKTIAAWCAEADVPLDAARDLARRLQDGPTAILIGWGMGRRSNGSAIVRAVDALSAISGNLWRQGGGASFYYRRRSAFDTSFLAGAEAAPRTVCEPLFGSEVLALRDPPIRAVWVTAGNPVVMLPDSKRVAEALRSRDFVVVVDPFETDTTACAHLVLPTTTLLEADDLVGAYGHHHLGEARPVVAPPEGVRSDLAIAQGLANRLGLGSLLDGTVDAWKRRLLEPKLAPHGVTLDTVRAAPSGVVRNPLAESVLFSDGRVHTASGRVQLTTDPVAPRAGEDATYPLTLMALSTDRSQSSQWSKPPPVPAEVTIHPDAAPDLPDGSLARLTSRLGELVVRVRHDPRQRRDVALMAKGGSYRRGLAANALTEARLTDEGEGGALYDQRVRLLPR